MLAVIRSLVASRLVPKRAKKLINEALKLLNLTYEGAKDLNGNLFHGNTRDLIQRYIYIFGVWEPNISRLVELAVRSCSTSRVFVDIGANVGFYSLLVARVCRDIEVLSFEPEPSIYGMLERNIQMNGFSSISSFRLAVGEKSGTTVFHSPDKKNQGTGSKYPDSYSSVARLDVPVVALDDFLSPDQVSKLRLIKIDAEGMELEVIRGALRTLKALPNDAEVLLELSPQKRGPGSCTEVINILEQIGFLAYVIPNPYSFASYCDRRDMAARLFRLSEFDVLARNIDILFSRRNRGDSFLLNLDSNSQDSAETCRSSS